MGMSRELRSRLATLVVLAVVAFGLYYIALREDVLHAPRAVTGPLYPDLATEDITWLYLRLAFGQDLELQREPGAPWRITRPTSESARQDYVEKLLDDLARATVEPAEVAGVTLRAADVGLEPPEHQISFGNDRQRETLLLGSVEPLGRMVYARRSGDASIVLATRNLETLLKFNAPNFVDPTLLRGLAGSPTHIRVERDGGVLLDAVKQAERWTLTAPIPAQADDDRINQLVRGLFFARATEVISTDPLPTELHALGLPNPAERAVGQWNGATLIEIGNENEAPVRAWVAAGWQESTGEVAALREDGRKVLAVPGAAFAMLNNKPSFFREHRVLPPLRDRAESLRLQRDGAVLLDLRRAKDGSWTFLLPERLAGLPVENDRVEAHSVLGDFLERIDSLEAVSFLPPPTGSPVADLQITWKRGGDVRLERLDLFAPVADGVPALYAERPQEGLLLPASVLELFAPETPDVLRRLAPLAIDDARWKGFRVEFPTPSESLEVVRGPDGGWTGDDEWGRRFGLGKDLQRGFRGFRWQRARPAAEYPWRLVFLDAEGNSLGDVNLRLPEADEAQEANGYPCALASLPGHDGVELVIARTWVDQVQALHAPQQRKP